MSLHIPYFHSPPWGAVPDMHYCRTTLKVCMMYVMWMCIGCVSSFGFETKNMLIILLIVDISLVIGSNLEVNSRRQMRYLPRPPTYPDPPYALAHASLLF